MFKTDTYYIQQIPKFYWKKKYLKSYKIFRLITKYVYNNDENSPFCEDGHLEFESQYSILPQVVISEIKSRLTWNSPKLYQ